MTCCGYEVWRGTSGEHRRSRSRCRRRRRLHLHLHAVKKKCSVCLSNDMDNDMKVGHPSVVVESGEGARMSFGGSGPAADSSADLRLA